MKASIFIYILQLCLAVLYGMLVNQCLVNLRDDMIGFNPEDESVTTVTQLAPFCACLIILIPVMKFWAVISSLDYSLSKQHGNKMPKKGVSELAAVAILFLSTALLVWMVYTDVLVKADLQLAHTFQEDIANSFTVDSIVPPLELAQLSFGVCTLIKPQLLGSFNNTQHGYIGYAGEYRSLVVQRDEGITSSRNMSSLNELALNSSTTSTLLGDLERREVGQMMSGAIETLVALMEEKNAIFSDTSTTAGGQQDAIFTYQPPGNMEICSQGLREFLL